MLANREVIHNEESKKAHINYIYCYFYSGSCFECFMFINRREQTRLKETTLEKLTEVEKMLETDLEKDYPADSKRTSEATWRHDKAFVFRY